LPGTLIDVTIALATFTLFFVALLIIRRMLLLFVVARRCDQGVVDVFSSTTAHF
jgi:hypothetical protein